MTTTPTPDRAARESAAAETPWPDRPLHERSLRVAMTGYVHDDDPTVIADMQRRIDQLGAALTCPAPSAAPSREEIARELARDIVDELSEGWSEPKEARCAELIAPLIIGALFRIADPYGQMAELDAIIAQLSRSKCTVEARLKEVEAERDAARRSRDGAQASLDEACKQLSAERTRATAAEAERDGTRRKLEAVLALPTPNIFLSVLAQHERRVRGFGDVRLADDLILTRENIIGLERYIGAQAILLAAAKARARALEEDMRRIAEIDERADVPAPCHIHAAGKIARAALARTNEPEQEGGA